MSSSRVAIVTGGGRGIGRGISLGLAADGLQIAIVYSQHPGEAASVAQAIQAQGGQAAAYQADVAVKAQVAAMVARVLADWGRIDVLVNNAGVASKATTAELDENAWDQVMDVNLKGVFLCSQAVIPAMQRAGGGRIIHMTSIAGQTGGGIGPHYAASKAGVIGLTRFMATELGPHGITVNAISPSGVPTELLSNLGMQPNDRRPVRRVGTPEDIAAAVSYLASAAAGYVTGQVLSVNGGSYYG